MPDEPGFQPDEKISAKAGDRSRSRSANPADAQGPPPAEGEVDFLAGPEPDGIPMTGEEDPLAEVDNPAFAPVVAEFIATERDRRGDGR